MGLELAIGGLAALFSIIGGIAQAGAMQQQAGAIRSQADAMREAAGQEREARSIEGAQQQVVSGESRRQRIREERIRRAQIIAVSENQGTGGSSGATGAVGALSTNLSGLIGSSLGQSKANSAITSRLQSAADWTAKGNEFAAQGEVYAAQGRATASMFNAISSGLSGFSSIFSK